MGNCGRCLLKQEPCLAEADGETEEAGGFCKLVDAVVSKQCLQDNLFHSLCFGCQSAKVDQETVKPIL